jgi:bleomycin hydrolase
MKENISLKKISNFKSNFDSNKKNFVAQNAVVNNGISNSCKNYNSIVKNTNEFSINLDAGDITNQEKSGRCWMFAALNVMKLPVIKNLNLKTIELSQNYPLFWDKLEKTNHFLENMIETAEEETSSRVVSYLLSDPLGDGGQWDMFAALVTKYGVVPKSAMPESNVSSNTRDLDTTLTTKLRGFAVELREAKSAGKSIDELRVMKEEMLDTTYRMLTISLGNPPTKFTYETRDKDDKFIRLENITPVEFFNKYVKMDMNDYVSLINAPTSDKPFGKTFTVQYLGNVRGGQPVKYLNLPINDLKNAAIKQMKDGEVVWFGSDVGQSSERESGLMALDILDRENLFSTTFPMTKAQRLDYGESLMTHAMVLTGVNLDKSGKPNRWRVENSWGDKVGYKGFFVMGDDWFNEYTFQVVVNKKYLTDEQKEMIKSEPIVLKPWDPMGSLAL